MQIIVEQKSDFLGAGMPLEETCHNAAQFDVYFSD